MTVTTWEDVSAAKCAAREALIPAEWRTTVPKDVKNVTSIPANCGVLTAEEVAITEMTAPKLIELMTAGTLTSEAVTLAFCKRAAIAHQLTNCLTEIFFDAALDRARAIDAEFKAKGTPAGPLHGLPISLKDNIDVTGYDSTVGFVSYANHPATEEADLVRTMINAGAVIFCKTNVPTGMLMGETYNNVWGYTPNPYNLDMGSGGSSGGEAALLALRGAALGVGTDIGGSIRMPAGICGIYGLKSTGHRFSSMGLKAGLPGQEAIKSVAGPMSADLESLELWSKVILDGKPWERDPAVLNMPWKDVSLPEKLCFGLIVDDGMVKPTPAVTRVLLETKVALEAAGHTVIEWTPYDSPGGIQLLTRFLMGDGGVKLRAKVREGEIPEPWPLQLAPFEHLYEMFKDKPPTVGGLWDLQVERQIYLRKLLASWMESRSHSGTGRPFDGVIAPVTPFPAAPRYTFKHAGYTALWNLADQTAVAIPAGWAKKEDTKKGDETFRSADEKEVWDKYDPEALDGMPVGLQIVVQRHQEELALKLARVTRDAISNYGAK